MLITAVDYSFNKGEQMSIYIEYFVTLIQKRNTFNLRVLCLKSIEFLAYLEMF